MEKHSFVSRLALGLAGVLLVSAAGCSGKEQTSNGVPGPGSGSESEVAEAVADIQEKSGSTVSGRAEFRAEAKTVVLNLALEGAKPGQHAVHIHEFGDCSAPDASSAGDHWNPLNEEHGRWGGHTYHLGDIGNINIDDTGKGTLTFSTDKWAIGTAGANDIVGKSIVVHDKPDDFMTQPGGAAGDRVACGVIVKL